MSLSLYAMARRLGGAVLGDKVVAPGPEAATHKVKWKRKRQTLTVWIGDDGDIRVHSHTGQDPIATKDWVRRKCGLPAWERRKWNNSASKRSQWHQKDPRQARKR